MAKIDVRCPVCGGTNVIKHGMSESGKQRYYCKDATCTSRQPKLNLRIKVFQLDTSIISRKVPINRFTKSIMATIPSEKLVIQNSKVWDAAAKALP